MFPEQAQRTDPNRRPFQQCRHEEQSVPILGMGGGGAVPPPARSGSGSGGGF